MLLCRLGDPETPSRLASSTALYAFGVAAIAVVNLALGALDPMRRFP